MDIKPKIQHWYKSSRGEVIQNPKENSSHAFDFLEQEKIPLPPPTPTGPDFRTPYATSSIYSREVDGTPKDILSAPPLRRSTPTPATPPIFPFPPLESPLSVSAKSRRQFHYFARLSEDQIAILERVMGVVVRVMAEEEGTWSFRWDIPDGECKGENGYMSERDAVWKGKKETEEVGSWMRNGVVDRLLERMGGR